LVVAVFRTDCLSIPVEAQSRCQLIALASGTRSHAQFSFLGGAIVFSGTTRGRYYRRMDVDAFLRGNGGREAGISVTLLIDRAQFDLQARFGGEGYPMLEPNRRSLSKRWQTFYGKLWDSEFID
jgi:hypothetical protein